MKEQTGETLPEVRTKLINIKKAKEDNLDMKEGTDLGNINDFKLSLQRKAQTTLEKIVNFIVEDGEIQVINNEEADTIVLGIKTSNPGALIGRHGHTLDALQYIVNIITNKEIEEPERRKIIVDIEGYKERREDIVSKYAREKAEIVKKTGKKIALCYMNAVERRIVHLVLQEEPLLSTYSEGKEPFRRVIIVPEENKNNINNTEEE
ncbi:MAG: KH domain-containing protein [Candidatus Atribacteria bacterium]|nr:KH domain-containing protein [Candidatus Atribacteria bacterium]MBE3127203.1 KH domain-containing protein [Candidatus Atribacteria bacterium]